MGGYELFETTADVGVRGYGESLEEAFENAARAMFEVMADVRSVRPEVEVEVSCEAEDLETLLVDWLNELLAQSTTRRMLFSEFNVKIGQEGSRFKLRGVARGEPIDPSRHELRTEVKAATYALIKVGREDDRYVAQLLLDI